MTTVEMRVQDLILTAKEGLVIPRVELAMNSVNAAPGRDAGSAVPYPDQIDFS